MREDSLTDLSKASHTTDTTAGTSHKRAVKRTKRLPKLEAGSNGSGFRRPQVSRSREYLQTLEGEESKKRDKYTNKEEEKNLVRDIDSQINMRRNDDLLRDTSNDDRTDGSRPTSTLQAMDKMQTSDRKAKLKSRE
mmetsp:Transcript_33883/g.30674  ORF Transcript_33883/g.30674 Transcript_33883/m.30674 type:complete len:136 (+) Transcript_33883:192-599(+)